MTSRLNILKATTALALVAGGLTAVANAQEAEEAEARQRTITVTASRRAESIQDIPLNIAAVGAEEIEEQGFDEISDVLAYVPGINVVDRGGRQGNPIIVRGLNADPLNSGDGNNDGGGTVATYIGEIPVFVDLKLNDLERVEVLLGPQGTLYGAGTLGGAIRYIPKKPDFEGDLFSIRAEAYQYGEADDLSTDMGFTFNKALGDNFAVRANFDIRNDSGFIDYPFLVQQPGVSNPDPDFNDPADVAANLRGGEDLNGEETLSGRLAARWAPTDWIDATATYYFQNADIEGRTLSSARSTVPAGEYEAGLRVKEPNKINNELFALEVTADLGFAELTSATGFSKFTDEGQRDQTDLLISLEYSYESFPTFTAFTREVGEEERINQELRLVSTTDGPLNWIVGGFYNQSEVAGTSSEFTPGYPAFAGLTDRPDALEYFSTANSKLVETALFGEVGYDITDKLSVTVGGRLYDYELEAASSVDFPLFEPLSFTPQTLEQVKNNAFDPDLAQADDGFLYKFNVSYDVSSDLLVYGTVSEGYRIGASNGVGQCDVFDPDANQGACALAPGQQFGPNPGDIAQVDERQFGPDTTTNYEIGFKSTLLDGDMTLNAAVFLVDWTDPQVSSATVNANIPITINAEGAESKGVEVSAAWRASDNFSVRGSFSHTVAELTADVPSLVRTITTPGFGTAFIDGEAGDRLPGSPETQFSVFGTYTMPLASGDEVLFNLGYAYQGDVVTRAGGKGDSLTLDEFGIANGSIVYNAADWKAALFVNNLFDEYAETGVRSTALSNQTVNGANVRSFGTFVAPPRAVGVRFSYDFE
jgi:outer membrane receptor protein involved in Fe transport